MDGADDIGFPGLWTVSSIFRLWKEKALFLSS